MVTHKRARNAIVLLAFFVVVTPPARGNGFTLEQVLSAPFPSGMVASPQGDKIAWIFRDRGRRNIYVAEAPAFKGRQITRYDKDDGREVTSLAFSPDGNLIAYVRGGPPNSDGEIPNPTSDAAGAEQEVWVANFRTGALARIAEGSDPFFSPRGERVIFSRDDRLWAAAAAGGSAKKMFEIRGQVGSPAWSPDGSELAFVSGRGDHSFSISRGEVTSYCRSTSEAVSGMAEPFGKPLIGDREALPNIRMLSPLGNTFVPAATSTGSE